jgi:nitronate monooxygenase/enoyl-[acyl-carrier protein] reductase II
MLHTPVCDLLGIDVPVVGAPFGPWEEVDLAVAVCEAGGLGSLGTAARPTADLVRQWEGMRERTDRPFAINHTLRPLDEEAFAATLRFRPAAISFHIGVPADLIARAHDAGVLWIQQVMDVRQAEEALAAGADAVVAQGGEAGGNGGWVATMVLVPQVLDVAGDVPVLAAGGIADGRGLAAALAMGAQGAQVGTRLLATREMRIHDDWKARIVAADALEAVKMVNAERVLPPYSRPGVRAEPRTLQTDLVRRLREEPESVDAEAELAGLLAAVREGGGHEQIPFAGQSVGLVHDVRPAGEVIAGMVAEAGEALAAAAASYSADSSHQ